MAVKYYMVQMSGIFKEIYNLLEVHGVSNKITTTKQLSLKVEQIFNNKKNSKKITIKD